MSEKQKGFKSDVLGAKPINLAKVAGATILEPKESKSSGKPGFFGQGALMVKCGDTSYKFQLGINLTAIDSAKQPMDDETRKAILASQPMVAETILKGRHGIAKQFSTGSVGFHHGDKVQLEINGKVVTFQLGVLLTAHGSKDWKDSQPAADRGEQPAAQ